MCVCVCVFVYVSVYREEGWGKQEGHKDQFIMEFCPVCLSRKAGGRQTPAGAGTSVRPRQTPSAD